jgi:hypothetical protein
MVVAFVGVHFFYLKPMQIRSPVLPDKDKPTEGVHALLE